jgi:hypothetical protein
MHRGKKIKIFQRGETKMANETAKKCAHPICTCPTDPDSKYCSAACAAVEDTPDIDCRCGHAICKGRAH